MLRVLLPRDLRLSAKILRIFSPPLPIRQNISIVEARRRSATTPRGFKLWNLLERFGKREIRVSTVVALVNTRAALRLIRGRGCHRWRIGGRAAFDLGSHAWKRMAAIVYRFVDRVIKFNVTTVRRIFSLSLWKWIAFTHRWPWNWIRERVFHLISFSSRSINLEVCFFWIDRNQYLLFLIIIRWDLESVMNEIHRFLKVLE